MSWSDNSVDLLTASSWPLWSNLRRFLRGVNAERNLNTLFSDPFQVPPDEEFHLFPVVGTLHDNFSMLEPVLFS